MSLRRPVSIIFCVGAAALISACGSSSKPAASPAGVAATSAATPATTPATTAAAGAATPAGASTSAAAQSGTATTPDPCSLLTAAEVSAATGGTVGEGVASAGAPPLNGKMCNWSNSGGPVIDFEVTLRTNSDLSSTSQTVDDLFSETTSTFPGLTAATGIGDKAFFGKTNGYVLKGGLLMDTVADIGGTADSSSINKKLTTMAVAKLP